MKFKPRVTSHESRATNKAFTLIELVVTIALLTMVISFTSVIFNVSIDAHRTSAASAEIMQKFRAITDQLNRDFRSLQKDAPLLIWFQKDNSLIAPNRFDQIMFFAAGDFQSIQLYSGSPAYPTNTGSPVVGNVARIYYGQAQRPNYDKVPSVIEQPWQIEKENDRMLARRRHILTAGSYVEWFGVNFADFDKLETIYNRYKNNDFYEHDRLSLAQWKTIPIDDYDSIVPTCFYERPWVDKGDPNTFHKLMCEGVGSFAIQWAYPASGFRWFPSNDPDGDNDPADSHFGPALMNSYQFGVHFNIPNASSQGDWHIIEDVSYAEIPVVENFPPDFYPRALKFTFTLYDSKGIIKNGREFTHIVYLDN